MNFSWYDTWPLLAMAALLYGAILAKHAREWNARRPARRRARAIKADLTGCIQRAGMKNCDPRTTPTTRKTLIEWCEDPYCFDDTPHREHK